MAHSYSEDQLVEQPAIGLFAELGWQVAAPPPAADGAGEVRDAGLLGREMKSDVVLVPRLREALEKLNPTLPPEAIAAAIDELTRDRSAMLIVQANREVYELLKDGVRVSVADPGVAGRGGQKIERVRVIDWSNPAANDFLLVSQFSITGALYTCRPDLVGFVNGLPLVVVELKKTSVVARAAFDENLTSYKHAQNGVPALFAFNALLIASNGTDSRVGSLTADWERFFEWKRVAREDEPRRVSLETMIRGTCDRTRLLDLVENFTLFSEHKAGLAKILGQNHQFLGVNNAIASMLEARQQGHGRGGVFWQTQGSGKSFSMVFFAQKVLRRLPGNWTFVVVTDRVELDDQIAKTFKTCGAVSEAEGDACHATSGAHLRELLRGNHRYIFTLIHKFKDAEVLCDRSDVIVLTDEAHRSQYNTLALNMRAALPKAMFLAFTGTPLIVGEERTKEVFGDYVSIYDYQQSVEDGATVPLFYENRTPELELTNPTLNEDIYDIIEGASLDEAQEERLAQVLGKQYHIITRDDRLDTVAKDIVRHFLGRGFQGKALVVSIDKATALRMYQKVARELGMETKRLKAEWRELDGLKRQRTDAELARLQEIRQRVDRIVALDMAVIVSPGQNEIEQMKKLGLDIVPHRKRMVESDPPLDERFKDTGDPLSLVFVCAMWLTGFDAPSCSTIYLDKPMRNHTLMQTIARANRVFPGKHSGLIVDYANVFASLEKALAIYGAGKGGKTPVRDKKQLLDDLRKAVAEATAWCTGKQVDLAIIEALPSGGMERLTKLVAAIDTLISPETIRREFLAHERIVSTLYDAVKPDPAVLEFTSRVNCLHAIADAIRAKINPGPPDISGVMAQIDRLLDDSIESVRVEEAPGKLLDLSKIDFEALAKRFKASKAKNIELETLKAAVRAMLERLIKLNRSRTDFQDKFEALIEAYNNGSKNLEEIFDELVKLSRELTEEETRHVRENLTEEELAIFDILTRPDPALNGEERKEVKKVAAHLLARLQQIQSLDWRQTVQARAKIKETIEETLDALPEAYTRTIFSEKCSRVFEHVYETRAS
ncbi:MAG TPA: type I restriction endonuclease subunit R [Lacunisphaera sp.]|jgi:type I restriction enzyme R subunit